MKLDSIFGGFNISAAGLSAQRKKMNSIASNLANAETTKTSEGKPYQRKVVTFKAKAAHVFSTVLQQNGMKMTTTQPGHLSGEDLAMTQDEVVPAGIDAVETDDPAPAQMVYDPGNPDANPQGYVATPNVNVVTEMVNMITTSRAFEANTMAINAAKTMAKDSLEI